MDKELVGVESESVGVFEGNVVEYSETLAGTMSSQALVKRKMEESDDVGESKNDSGKRRRYVLVYKEDDDDDFGNGLDSGAEFEEEAKVESVVLAGVENLKLTESDLVWGKVRSYPWWPGQVVDASVASKLAKKYFKKGKLLIAYFGDCSFAWNEVCMIKPFHQHFEKMVEQSNSVEFRDAVDCALEEVARRVEFGLSCACVSEEGYLKLKTQNIVNAGIREESCVRYGGDKLSDAMFFEPAKLVEYMRDLACFPSYDASEKLMFVSNRARVLAFQQWKGYFNFLEYETFLRSVVSTAPKVSLLEPKTNEEMFIEKKGTDYKDDDDHKERFGSEDKTDEDTKEKTLSDFIALKRSGRKSTEKFDGESHSEKKRKVESSVSGNSEEMIKNNCPTGDLVTPNSDIMSVGDAEFDEMLLSLYSTETQKGIAESFSTDQFMKDISCSNLEDDSKKTSITETPVPTDVKDTSDEQILPENKDVTDSVSKEEIVKDCSAASIAFSTDQFMKDISCVNLDEDSKKASITETPVPTDVKETSDEQILPANKDITDLVSKEQIVNDYSVAPIALILNFADSSSVPSVEKLNKAFNCYGPLKESETKIMKKSARIVFKRREDAESAFSAAGKYSIFGPSLLSYKLKFV